MTRKPSPAEYAWLGLVSYIFVVDCAIMIRGHEPMTKAWRDALTHPINRWVVILAWVFTTKHLFFGNFLPKVDPFAIIAISVGLSKRLLTPGGTVNGS